MNTKIVANEGIGHWMFFTAWIVLAFLFSRGCDNGRLSPFEHWLEAHYGYEVERESE